MASMGSSSGDIFDHRKLRRLVQLMQEHDLTEIDLRQAEEQTKSWENANFVNLVLRNRLVLGDVFVSLSAVRGEHKKGS